MASHKHFSNLYSQDNVEIHGSSVVHNIGKLNVDDTGHSTALTGGDVPHNNIHPVQITHVWERIG